MPGGGGTRYCGTCGEREEKVEIWHFGGGQVGLMAYDACFFCGNAGRHTEPDKMEPCALPWGGGVPKP